MDQSTANLNLVNKENVSSDTALFIQDVSESETKNIILYDLTQFVISSSNILSALRTGSFTGSFFGVISGSSPSSSYTQTANFSQQSFFLNYSSNFSNGSSSYSLNSLSSSLSTSSSLNLTSSYSDKSTYSSKTAYVDVLTANTSSNSLSASNSSLSSYSNSSLFLNYNGIDNGTSLRSIISETALVSPVVKNLVSNNVSTSSFAISSSQALFAEKSLYIQKTEYSKFSTKSTYTSKNVYAFINFQFTGDQKNPFDIYSWKNINTSTPIKYKPGQNNVNPFGSFFIYFDQQLEPGEITTVVSDWNFITSKFVHGNTLFKKYSFPNKHYGMVVGVYKILLGVGGTSFFDFDDAYLEWYEWDPTPSLIGSTFSVVAYRSVKKFPSTVSLYSTPENKQLGGCAAL